jgi:uncharacterized membrane protein YgcG
MTSAEAGVLIDDKTDNRDLLSLIFYWATKGLLEIEEKPKEGLFGKNDYILIKKADLPDDAKPYEKTFFNGLFPGSTKNVRISTLKDNFYTTMQVTRDLLEQEIKKEGYYEKGSRTMSNILKSISFAMLFGGIVLGFAGYGYDYTISLAISAVITFIFGYIMPKKTDKGLEKYQILKGFADFIEKAEKPRIKRLLEEDPNYFEKTIPFAIALNVLDKWSPKFEGLVTEPPSWYRGHYGPNFTTIALMHSLNHSMSHMNKDFSSQPSSSGTSGDSGFGGGGGFSGGGFGGGGGGSW